MTTDGSTAPDADRARHAHFADVYGTFAKEGGRVGSGALGSGQGGVARCAR
ncbi:sulfate adenylyltransferase [Streptomyces albidoflavus]|nr:sulfate adenylyltransferase [Streptomyces albidoflavus]